MKRIVSILLVVSIFFTSCISIFADGLNLPANLQRIEDEAFYYDSSITSVYIPYGTLSIGNNAFAYSGLLEAHIPETVEFISPSAFEGLSEDFTIYAPKYSRAYDFAMEKDFQWLDSGTQSLNELLEILDDEILSMEDAEFTIDDIDFESVSTEGLTDSEVILLIDEYNAALAELFEANDSFKQQLYSVEGIYTDFEDYLAENQFSVGEESLSINAGDLQYNIPSDILNDLENVELVNTGELQDGTVLIELSSDSGSFFIQADETGLSRADAMQIREAETLKASNSFVLTSRTAASNKSWLDRISDVMDSFVSISNGIEGSISNWIDNCLETAISRYNRWDVVADKATDLSTYTLTRFQGSRLTNVLNARNAALLTVRSLESIKGCFSSLNIAFSLRSIQLDLRKVRTLIEINGHGHPTVSETNDPTKARIASQMQSAFELCVPFLAARMAYAGLSIADGIRTLFSMISAFSGPAGWGVNFMTTAGIKGARAAITILITQMGLTLIVNHGADTHYKKVVSLHYQLHNIPTPTPIFSPTPAAAFTPTPTVSPTIITSITPALTSTPINDDQWDPDFLEWCINEFDSDHDGELEEYELLNVRKIDCYHEGFTSLAGIQNFPNLEILDCGNNQLTSLDVSGLSNLKELKCYRNQLTSLNVSGLSNLQTLRCNENQLTSLIVSGLPNLQTLRCNENQLTSLNISNLPSLTKLDCDDNHLTSLIVSGLPSLDTLWCGGNQLTSLNVSELSSLEDFVCSRNKLTSLDVTGLTKLSGIYCFENQLTSLNISGLPSLATLSCDSNKLTSLILSNLPSLSRLECYNNRLTSLDLSGLSNLKQLFCYSNQLTSLDVASLSNLELLWCYDNQLTSLNVSGLSNLESLYCNNNRLTTLNISGCSKLTYLRYDNNVTVIR